MEWLTNNWQEILIILLCVGYFWRGEQLKRAVDCLETIAGTMSEEEFKEKAEKVGL